MKIALSQRFAAALALAAFSVIAAACGNPPPSPTPSNQAQGLSFVQVGRGEMSDAVASGLFSQGAEVDRVEGISEIGVAARTAVLFDGGWFEEHGDSPEALHFLKTAVQSGVPVAIIGGRTSELYRALQEAGALTIATDESGVERNPAYTNPPIAGFALIFREGDKPSHSHFGSNGVTPGTLTQGLLQWRAVRT